jgi:hypothetical protein
VATDYIIPHVVFGLMNLYPPFSSIGNSGSATRENATNEVLPNSDVQHWSHQFSVTVNLAGVLTFNPVTSL